MDPRKRLGGRSEKLAASFLRRKGYRLVAHNYVCPAGEADLIVVDGDTIVFVEVRTRQEGEVAPEATIVQSKKDALSTVARTFLHDTNAWALPCRVDVVAITLKGDGEADIKHYIDAFNLQTGGRRRGATL
ncbi:MAG: YraN family protein [Planctomycetia bacterium]|nr:MAG: YraN family protein [Planctomycetota bacterium]KAB2948229.1 MAG: YraN family protein [Phycisphaerae bacterium]MBE7457864.1 YraN family protein [Planctomycetia bacterium]MCK6465739.1 YraN family protein [Phycisphaerae bacterium]MCQ3921493.1 YraN family protein [Planctomycetota bacterium]